MSTTEQGFKDAKTNLENKVKREFDYAEEAITEVIPDGTSEKCYHFKVRVSGVNTFFTGSLDKLNALHFHLNDKTLVMTILVSKGA